MEEMTNNLNETMEVIPMEVEVTEIIETEEVIKESNNVAIIGVAIAAAAGLGYYGFKKFNQWRKSKKQSTTSETLVMGNVDVEEPEETTGV